ncbi:MAG: putative vacuolar protein-sorting-associated protein 33 [Streblomastix strix]|uniref:Putative vacuolar protein-sorting-associated protein 33 n=1 Tax=Streblomastix strix TaxID=222440 RepID=A0A5J4WZ62_9EUKA|nr:MAG: putative vacuolar protein-sorting-associated protein 33 [Streblomastix strix]
MITPLATQLTYLGLVDEFMGIQTSCINFESSKSEVKKQRVILRQSDSILSEIGDLQFGIVGKKLHDHAKGLSDTVETGKAAADIAGLHQFVKQLPEVTQRQQNLSMHIQLAEQINRAVNERRFHEQLEVEQALLHQSDAVGVGGLSGSSISSLNTLNGKGTTNTVSSFLGSNTNASDYIEERMGLGTSPWSILRLIGLYTQTVAGLKQSAYEALKSSFLQTYGYHHIHTLVNAETAGILKQPETKQCHFAKQARILHLLVDEEEIENENDPNDFSYTFACYAPLSVRIIQYAFNRPRGWISSSIDEGMQLTTGDMHGYSIKYIQGVQSQSEQRQDSQSSTISQQQSVTPMQGKGKGGLGGLDIEQIIDFLKKSNSNQQNTTNASLVLDSPITQPQPHSTFTAPRNTTITRNGVQISGDTIEALAALDQQLTSASAQGIATTLNQSNTNATLIVFVGGITYAEVSAIRHFARKQNKNIIIATTGVINGSRFVETMREEIRNRMSQT